MTAFDLSTLVEGQLPTGTWAAALLHALAREEAAGRKPERLMEPKLATWARFKGRLNSADLIALLFEDAAVLHRIPFADAAVDSVLRISRLPESVASDWIGAVRKIDLSQPGPEYIADQARMLGLPTRLARSDLHTVKTHQRVLELPGSGGQLSHHVVTTQPELSLKDNLTIACCSWQELTLAGVVALDLAAPNTDFVTRVEPASFRDAEHPIRKQSFDFVVGLHPDKGGQFQEKDELAIWFPNAKVLLV